MTRFTCLFAAVLFACSDDAGSSPAGGTTGDGGTVTNNGDGGTSNPGNDGGTTNPTPGGPIGKKAGGFQLAGKDRNGAADAIAGTHDVVIYRTPADRTSWIGAAKLSLTRNGTELTAKLVAADGSVVQEVTNDMENPREYGQATVTPVIGKVLIDERGKQPYERIDINAAESGYLFGVVGGLAPIAFRNDVLAYGLNVPAQLAALDGTWKGEHMAAVCRAPVEAVFAAGKVTVKGKPQPGCGPEETSEVTWNGNDDYVVPNAAGNPQIFIDTANGGGSNPSGGTQIDLTASGTIAELRTFFSGFQNGLPKGDVASINLTKQ